MNFPDIKRPLKLDTKSYGKIDIPFMEFEIMDDHTSDIFYFLDILKKKLPIEKEISGIYWDGSTIIIYVLETNEQYIQRMKRNALAEQQQKKVELHNRRSRAAKLAWARRKKEKREKEEKRQQQKRREEKEWKQLSSWMTKNFDYRT